MNYGEMILQIIQSSKDHPTAEEIFLKMKEQGSHVALATVYNNLARLIDEDRIRKVIGRGASDRYDRVERHDHLMCERCGKLMDFRFSDLKAHLQEQVAAEVLDYDLRVRVICPDCRAAQEPGEAAV